MDNRLSDLVDEFAAEIMDSISSQDIILNDFEWVTCKKAIKADLYEFAKRLREIDAITK